MTCPPPRRDEVTSATLERVDTFRAQDLTDEHLGLYVRTREYEGRLRGLIPARPGGSYVQVLLVDGDGPYIPSLPLGEPVELTPDP